MQYELQGTNSTPNVGAGLTMPICSYVSASLGSEVEINRGQQGKKMKVNHGLCSLIDS